MAARASTARVRVMLAVLAAVLAVAPAAGAALTGNVATVKADTLLHLKGSDMYCTVLKEGATLGVACFHDPGGPSSAVRKGYLAVATERGVAVEPPGTNTPSTGYAEPKLTKFGVISGGAAHTAAIDLGVDQVVGVSGSHMAVFTTPAVGGGTAIGVTYVDPKFRTIIGAYTIGISNHYISIVKVTGNEKTKVAYRHAIY